MTRPPRPCGVGVRTAATAGTTRRETAAMVSVALPVPRSSRTHPRLRRRGLLWYAVSTGLMAARSPDPYEPLRLHLAAQPGEELTLTFAELEVLLGTPLPDEAWLRTWWTNTPGVPQARAWLRAGWRVHWVRRSGDEAAVTFTRSAIARP